MRTPVTNAQYNQFVQATGHRCPVAWRDGVYPADKADHPVTGVTYQDALAFCRWAREITGLPVRLPTEPEWEKAARGPDDRLYPWGNQWRPELANNRENKSKGTTPVNAFSPQGDSPYGVADTAGNVQEWCSSLFGSYPYDPADGREAFVNNLNPASCCRGNTTRAPSPTRSASRPTWASKRCAAARGAAIATKPAASIAAGPRPCIAAMIRGFGCAMSHKYEDKAFRPRLRVI